MPALGQVIKGASRVADIYFVFRFLRLLTMKYEKTDAYKYGIIDKKGKPLKKSSDLTSNDEKASYTMLHRMVFKIRRLIEKIPLIGKSILLNYAAALFLLKEQKNPRIWTNDNYMKRKLFEYLETDWETDAILLKEEVDNMEKKSFKTFLAENSLEEEWIDDEARKVERKWDKMNKKQRTKWLANIKSKAKKEGMSDTEMVDWLDDYGIDVSKNAIKQWEEIDSSVDGRTRPFKQALNRLTYQKIKEARFDHKVLLQQLGSGKFIAMTGAKNLTYGPDYLQFKIGRNSKGINFVKITLTPKDTYTMEFCKIRKFEVKCVTKEEDVYGEDLRKVFTKNTGMQTSLGTLGETVELDEAAKLGTFTLNTGQVVSAKEGKGYSYSGQKAMQAYTFTNRTQAEKHALKVGGMVIKPSRIFYVEVNEEVEVDEASEKQRKYRKEYIGCEQWTEEVEVDEVAPPGWEGTVKAMKKKKGITNPWALAWYMKNKGMKPQIPEEVEIDEVLMVRTQKVKDGYKWLIQKVEHNKTEIVDSGVEASRAKADKAGKKARSKIKEEVEIDEDAKMGRQSDAQLRDLFKTASAKDQSLPSNKHFTQRVAKEMKKRGIKEEVPTNTTAGIAGLDIGLTYKKKKKDEEKAKELRKKLVGEEVQRGVFAGKDVFIVDPDTFHQCRMGKRKYEKYEKYVGSGKIGQAIREYGLKNPRKPIILQRGESGPMLYLRYGVC